MSTADKAEAAAEAAKKSADDAERSAEVARGEPAHVKADPAAVQQADLAAAATPVVDSTSGRGDSLANEQQDANVKARKENPVEDHTHDVDPTDPEYEKPGDAQFPTRWHRERYAADLEREVQGAKVRASDDHVANAEAELARVRGGKESRLRDGGKQTRSDG